MNEGYSLGLRILHWLTAVLVLVQVSLAVLNTLLYEPRPILAEWLVQAHISLGAVILTLTLCRILLRLRSPVPPRSPCPTIRNASNCVHLLLYACLLALPISGYLKLAALGFEIRLFAGLPLPALALDPALAAGAKVVHEATALVLGALVMAHIAAALLHNRLDGQSVLRRMTF